jgi:hypothetical protein
MLVKKPSRYPVMYPGGRENMTRITINGVSLDPTSSAPAMAGIASADASQSDYVLVQTAAPLTPD